MKCAVFCVAFLLYGQTDENRGAIEGKVLDIVTEIPIQAARITFETSADQHASVASDGGGSFHFSNMMPGAYRISASAPGYLTLFRQPITLSPGEDRAGLTLRLIPLSKISGEITDDDGNPIRNLEVQAWRITYSEGFRALRAENNWTHTNKKGAWQIQSLRPGRYYVSAAQTGEADKEAPKTYARQFYPGTPDVEAAAPVDLSPGTALSNIDFKLTKIGVVRVTGKVRGPGPADITLIPENSQFRLGVLTKSSPLSGKFEIDAVVPGEYRLQAHWRAGDRDEWASRAISVSTTNVDGIELSLAPGPSLTAHIVPEDSSDEIDPLEFGLELRPADIATPGIMYATHAEKDGSFRFDELPPGRFRLGCSHMPSGFYIKAVRAGNQEVPNRALDFSGGFSQQAEVVVARGAATVTGAVESDERSAGAGSTVVLLPLDMNRQRDKCFYPSAVADGAGHFVVSDVPPGEYRAFVWDDHDVIDENLYMDPAFMATMKTAGVALDLGKGDTANIEVPLSPGPLSAAF